jgi:hypothetical protein
MFKEAVDEYLKYLPQVGVSPERIASLRDAFARSGMIGYLREEIGQLESNPSDREVFIAERYAQLGDTAHAFEWLERAFASHSDGLLHLKEDMFFANLRSDPRFVDLLRRVGLPH